MINFLVVYGLSLIFLALLMFCCLNIIFSVLSFAPWLPIHRRDLERVFKLADLKAGQVFYDLGCGDGRVIFYAAKNYKVQALGLEMSWPFYLICRFKKFFYRYDNLTIKFKNLFKEKLSSADVIYFFGVPSTINEKLVYKLKQELKPGAKIISYSFKLNDWMPKIIDKPREKDVPVYLYEV